MNPNVLYELLDLRPLVPSLELRPTPTPALSYILIIISSSFLYFQEQVNLLLKLQPSNKAESWLGEHGSVGCRDYSYFSRPFVWFYCVAALLEHGHGQERDGSARWWCLDKAMRARDP